MNARFGDLAGKGPMGLKQAKKAKGKDPAHLGRVAGLPCVICHEYGMPQLSPTQVHHCIHGRYSQEKRPDAMTIPLCEGHHTGLLDTSKIAIHKASKTWASLYGEDTRWISWVDARLSARGQKPLVRSECKADGCNKREVTDGYCGPHYRRNLKHGHPLAGGTPQGAPIEWIKRHASHAGDDCLYWPFSKTTGYYSVQTPSGYSKAHRVMCEAAHGVAPVGAFALHSCGNKSCVNPKHLRWGTPRENTHDAILHGTFGRGEKSGSAKVTADDVRAMRQRHANGERLGDIASDYPITKAGVWAIVKRKAWNHVE